ncbi:hypothetical protein [Ruminococcus sp.]|uniref:hypothetical protein n=1 Tax=Ruminococcus sp. TaxID=41978 RepID=UPI00258D5FA3|nr:hypothetical protein [Ruminococcus sp.]MCR5019993.1 hypothetical protein [Ruminococcus sp.]
MKRILEKFNGLTISKKIQLITAMVLTVAFLTAIPVYAWFTSQKKAAEMYKIEYPNSLYINAAHREDRMYFKLDTIDVNEYAKDESGDTIYKDGKPVFVTEKNYIFTVTGANAEKFILQMAHTNNNLFNYTIYEAKQYDYLSTNAPAGTDSDKIVPSGTDEDNILDYKTNPEGYTENPFVFADDPVNKSSSEIKYYVIGSKVSGEYKNNTNNYNPISSDNLAKNNDNYYTENYGTNTKVESHAIPSYWQGVLDADPDSNKQFCKYFVLKVTWDPEVQRGNAPKETDMIYFSVKRKD